MLSKSIGCAVVLLLITAILPVAFAATPKIDWGQNCTYSAQIESTQVTVDADQKAYLFTIPAGKEKVFIRL